MAIAQMNGPAQAQVPDQVQAAALPTNPKILTKPKPFDGSPAVVPLGTGFLLAWQSGPSFDGTTVFARQFSDKGKALQKVVTLKKATQNLVGRPKIADLGKGKFAIVWQSVTQDFNQTPIIEGTIFDAATNKHGKVVTITTTTSAIHEIFANAQGNIALLTQQQNVKAQPFVKEQVVAFLLNPKTLKVLKGPTAMNGDGDADIGPAFDHTAVSRPATGFAIWRNRDASPPTLMMDGFNQDAAADGNPIQVNTTPFLNGISGNDTTKFSVRAARLTNDNVVVTWATFENTHSSYEVRARLYRVVNNTPTPIGKDFLVNKITTGDQYWPKPIALPGGAFAIAYLSEEAFNERRHYVRVYTAGGKPVGNPKLTQKVTNPPTQTIDNSVARLKDGSLADVFSDTDFNNGQVLGDGIPATQIKP
jgi:hypothetical protein